MGIPSSRPRRCAFPLVGFLVVGILTQLEACVTEDTAPTSPASTPGPISRVPTSVTAFVGMLPAGPTNEPKSIRSLADLESTFGPLTESSPLGRAVRDYFANGGTQAVVVRAKESSTYGAAISALDFVDVFNLLCVLPPSAAEDVSPVIWQTAVESCLKHRAVLIVDPPRRWKRATDVQLAELGFSGDQLQSATLYFPMGISSQGGRRDTVPPSGAVAGVIARTDSGKGVWVAPAGNDATLAGIDAPSVPLSETDVNGLTSLGVNMIRTIPGSGVLVWGARTLAGADLVSSEWKYLSVRRLGLFIEESIARGTRWAALQPNRDTLWSQIRLSVNDFLYALWRQGAFQGTTVRDGYFVRCDATTTTQNDIANGVVNILVGFAPLKPAEFVILRVQQSAGRIP